MPETQKKNPLFSIWAVLLPVAIGIGVVVLMFFHDTKSENLTTIWHSIDFRPVSWICIVAAFLCMFGRDFGLTWRFRALTDRQLKWGQAYKVDFLCEFTSCVTPSAVGGSSLGMVFLNTQGIGFGRATTLMMTTLLLDELFFVLACPVVVLLTPARELFASGGTDFSGGIKYTFWAIYAVLFLWTLLLFLGIIVKPDFVKNCLVKLFSLKFLRRWLPKIEQLANNMIATSVELRKKSFRFWLEVFMGTALSWISRFLVVNVLFLGLVPSSDPYQGVILAREFIIWVVLMVCPTPGGSGLSEWLFSEYYGDLVHTAGLALILAIIWRIVSYYLYLLIGAIILPGWLKESYYKYSSHAHKSDTEAVTADNSASESAE